ncbi:Brain-enriched guanylate kinase-associated protein [Larimichthys crocea]|uniref:Uncharacterized protein n=1 Tax=Larimichthys crocea TaxID=215358 RepID=A0ACD3RPK4_LARCR|nr:Brain-enriched guanylate kinase-associated protein [Larimichthys crocea]
MVHLCVSISDDGLRLESVQKGSPKTVRTRRKKVIDMATLRRKPRSRTGSARQDRGSCSSTVSCPVFSGPYSDQEEDPPMRRQSSPLLKGSLSSLHNSPSPSPKGSLSSLQGSGSCLQGSLPSLQVSLPKFHRSLSSLKGSISRLRRRSLGNLDNSSPSPSERSASPSIQSGNDSSSDDDASWDTNSWSSGATCLLRTPVKQESNEASEESGEKSCTTDQASATANAEPEIIYQNLLFSRPAAKTESKGGCAPERTTTAPKKDTGTQSVSSTSQSKNAATVSFHQRDEKTENRRKFSQFLNEVTFRVLKSKGSPTQQLSSLRHRLPSPPPPPPLTPSHSTLTTPLHSTPTNPPPAPSTSASNLWYSPTSANLQTIKEYESKDITTSIHQWSKTLPICKILEPGDVLRKVKVESHSYPEHDLELCTKIQAQPSTGRLYLETDIDRVRQLDELAANGTLGKERNEKGLEKGMERGKKRENRNPWERNGGLVMEKGKEKEKRKEIPWEKDRGTEKEKEKKKGREMPCWEKDKRMERGREKEKKELKESDGEKQHDTSMVDFRMSNLDCDDKEKRLEGEKHRILSSKAKFGCHGPLYSTVPLWALQWLNNYPTWQQTVLTSHHHCSGDLIHSTVFWPLVVEHTQETVVFLESSAIRRNTQHMALNWLISKQKTCDGYMIWSKKTEVKANPRVQTWLQHSANRQQKQQKWQQLYTHESRGREKNMKKIYIGKTALKTQRNGCKHPKRSSFHDHKDDLRKRLSYTTHKLEMVETEFDSTRQYLETELRRAQEELEKFTEKLRRIQSSYAALQRINQDLEDKMHRTSHHHEEEKRALSREIIVLNNHLMEAKITINKLREDNDLYRKDCNLAAQLLQCSKSHYRAHKMSELPLDFQQRISSHIEKHNRGSGVTMAMCHSNYSDAVPTSLIAKVLEKPEPGSSCPVTRSPSPQPQDGDFLTGRGSTDHLNRRISYKSSDLYCSDTALYCPERWQDTERRQSVDPPRHQPAPASRSELH